jgi:enoyl-CoA hydratase/carnithine racemase
MIDAAKAAQYGLVSEVVAAEGLMTRVNELAAKIASNPPLALRHIKEGLRRGVGQPASALPDLAAYVGNGLARLFQTRDHAEAAAAFVAKRPAVFTGE